MARIPNAWVAGIKPLAEVASPVLEQMAQYKRTQGGVTPAQLQALAGRWGEATNPGMAIYSFDAFLLRAAAEWRAIRSGTSKEDERTVAAMLMMLLMHLAWGKAFDLLEVTYEAFETTLQSVIAEAAIESGGHEHAD